MLYTLRVTINFQCEPWSALIFEGDTIRCLKRSHRDVGKDVFLDNPRFWKDVRQLSFAFQRNERAKIRDFYQKYGPVLATPFEDEESFSQVAKMLDWFRHLTLMAEWIKEEKAYLLSELLPRNPRYTQPFMVFFGGPDPLAEVDPFYGEPDGMPVWPSIWTTPFGEPTEKEPYFRGPQNEEELYSAAWTAIVSSLWTYFRREATFTKIPFHEPVFFPSLIPGLWLAHVGSALSAAVYQWYFEELAEHLSGNTGVRCSADGCERLVPPHRIKHTVPGRRAFCSSTCRERQKKRDQRQRLAEKDLTV